MLPEIPLRRAVPITTVNRAGASDGFFPAHVAFPVIPAGRRAPLHLRGLLWVRSRYSPKARSIDQGDLGHEPSIYPVTKHIARQLPELLSIIWVEPSSTGLSRHRAALKKGGLRVGSFSFLCPSNVSSLWKPN